MRGAIVTRWVAASETVVNPDNSTVVHSWFVPAIFADVAPQTGDSWSDVTTQPNTNIPPSPNVLIVEVNFSAATLAAIKAHAQYGNLAVLWEGDPALSPVVTETQYDNFAQWLLNKVQNNGYPNATLVNVYTALGGTNSNGRTRYEIALTLIAWLRERPKA